MEAYVKGALLGEGTFGKVHQYTQKSVSMVHRPCLVISGPHWWLQGP